MSRPFYTPIDMAGNELQNAVIQNLASAPGAPTTGRIYYSGTSAYILVWNGSRFVDARARSEHLGTQLSVTISDLASTVQAYRLNQFASPTANIAMSGFTFTGLSTTPNAAGQAAEYSWVISRNLNAIAVATPTSANIPMSGFKLTGLATPSAGGDSAEYSWVLARSLSSFTGTVGANIPMNGFKFTGLPTPTTAGDSAEYSWVIGYVQSLQAGIASKDPVSALATINIAALSGFQTIDGVAFAAGSDNKRVLLGAAQTTASQRGVWIQAAGAWTRPVATEGATNELDPGAQWFVINGATNAGTTWQLTTPGPIVPGTTSLTITQNGAQTVYAANNGVVLVGNNFSAVAAPGGGLSVSSSGIDVNASVARSVVTPFGDGASLSYVLTHNLGKQFIRLQVFRNTAPYDEVEMDKFCTSATTSTFSLSVAATVNQFVAVMG